MTAPGTIAGVTERDTKPDKWKTQAGLAWRATFPDSDMSDAPRYWQRRQRWHNRRGTAGGR